MHTHTRTASNNIVIPAIHERAAMVLTPRALAAPLSFHAPRRRPPLRPSPLNRAARPAAPSSVSSHVAHARFLPGEYATPPADLAVVNSGVTHTRYL